MTEIPEAIVYRMVLPDHICPYGVRAKELLEAARYDVKDRVLSTREEVEAAKEEFDAATTPVVVIDGEVIGGCMELEKYLAGRETGC